MAKFRQTLNNIRVDAVNELIGIMKKHNCKEVETYEFDDTPIAIKRNGGYTYAIDTIRVVDDTEPYLIFSCSSNDCEEITSNDVTIHNLVNILSWVLSNEEWLFENED
jgi:hypothetical protein